MSKNIKKLDSFPSIIKSKPDKIETYSGKVTARVTRVYKNDDGSQVKATKKNKDGTITDKLEYRHK